MPDEIALAIAYALVAKAAEMTVAGAKSALSRMHRLIRDRFGGGEQGTAAVRQLTQPGQQIVLAGELSQAMANDPEFARLLHLNWERAREELERSDGTVANYFGGTAQKVVQAGVIGGDVHL